MQDHLTICTSTVKVDPRGAIPCPKDIQRLKLATGGKKVLHGEEYTKENS